jgi:hypothetical protein
MDGWMDGWMARQGCEICERVYEGVSGLRLVSSSVLL